MARSPGTIASARHVFEVLKLASRSKEPIGVAELSRRAGLPTSTVHRALVTLEETGFLSRYQSSSKYEVGLMPQHLGRALFNRFKLREASWPILKKLAAATGETVSLSVRLGWYSLRIAAVEGGADVFTSARIGEAELLTAGTAARCLLAFLREEERLDFVNFARRSQPGALIEDARLAALVAGAQQHGYLMSAGGPTSLAFPVRIAGSAVAAIAVDGPTGGTERDRGRWSAEVVALERQVADSPERFVSPFAHIPPDEIDIQTALGGRPI